MITKNLLIIASLLLSQMAGAQIMFEQTYGGNSDDWGSCVLQTSDGGYILTGGTASYGLGSYDVYLIKVNSFGGVLWSKTYGGSGWDFGSFVKQTMDGGYIISGKTSSFGAGSSDMYLIRTNATGDTIWTRTFGGIGDEVGGPVIENTDGTFIMVGNTLSYASGFSAAYIVKTDSNGLIIWSKVFEKNSVSGAGDIQKTNDGYYLVSGYTYDVGDIFNSNLYLLKLSNDGDTIWTKTISNSAGGLSGAKISLTGDNNFVFTGTLFLPNGSAKIYLMKTDTSGNIILFKGYGSSDYQSGGNSLQTNDGGFIVTGVIGDISKNANFTAFRDESILNSIFDTYWENGDLYLLRTDINGDSLWSKSYGGTGDDVGNSVQQTNDNGFIICGYSNSFSGSNDVYLIKTDVNGMSDIENIYLYSTHLNIYPNPCTGVFQVQSSTNKNENARIEIMNYSGQVILYYDTEAINSFQIDLRNQPNGLYLLNIKGENYNIFKKLIMQK